MGRIHADGASVTTSYTASGQVDTVTDASGTTDHDYDVLDRLSRITYPSGQSIEYSYDARGNKLSLQSGGHSVTYRYNAINQLESVTDEIGETTYGYDHLGNLAHLRYPNGTETTYRYDSRNRLIEQVTLDGSGAELARLDYTLDSAGHRTHLVEGSGRLTAWRYDNLYRLIEEAVLDAQNGSRITTWTYDAVGNRLTQSTNGATTTYSYDANDRLLSESGARTVSYSYDANGNTVEKNDAGTITTYRYDGANRLVGATTPTAELACSYDASGIRQSRTENGQTIAYLIDPNQAYAQVIGEYQSGSEQAWYTYGQDLISQSREGQESYYHYDGLGTTRALTDSDGAVTDSYAYTAFGEMEQQSGGTENSYLYTGEQFDVGLGLYYLRARYMDVETGRFSALDPILGADRYPGSLHKYVYAGNLPTLYLDPTGESFLASQMLGIEFSMSIGNSIRTVSLHSGRRAFNQLMFGHPPGDWGIIGDHIMNHLLLGVEEVIQSGEVFGNKGAFGTKAHKNVENSLKQYVKGYEVVPGVTIEAEVFIHGNGGAADYKRQKGSLGMDVVVMYQDKPALLVDLKTGRGFAKKKRREIMTRFEKMAGREVPLVEVIFNIGV